MNAAQIKSLLDRKREIESLPEGQFTAHQRWLLDATELLLRSLLELRQDLQNNGILR